MCFALDEEIEAREAGLGSPFPLSFFAHGICELANSGAGRRLHSKYNGWVNQP